MAGVSSLRVKTKGSNQWGDYPYRELHPSARLFIGLTQSTDLNNREIGRIMGFPESAINDFERELMEDEEARLVMIKGLPSVYGWDAERSATCRSCTRRIVHFPCAFCCQFGDVISDATRPESNALLRPCNLATYARPGSLEKVAVMAARVQAGMEPFCLDDPPPVDDMLVTDMPVGRKTPDPDAVLGPFESQCSHYADVFQATVKLYGPDYNRRGSRKR